MILVPVKNLSGAKQRLAALFDQPTRTELAQAMLFDVLETLGTWTDRPEVAVVTSDPFAIQLAGHFHFLVVPDEANRSQTDAIEMATRFCEARDIASTLVIPRDIPLIHTWELEQILQYAPAQESVLLRAAGWAQMPSISRPAGYFPWQRQFRTSPPPLAPGSHGSALPGSRSRPSIPRPARHCRRYRRNACSAPGPAMATGRSPCSRK
jgi:2-phospho-L-lactate guanylyltransferase